jgi:DNA-binding MarR family transcriptional regulator
MTLEDDDAERIRTMEALDRLVSWAVAFKRQPLTDELTVHQAGVLHVCIGMGPVGLDELGRLLGSAPSTLTAVVGRLEGKGLVRRDRDPDDGRKVRVSVTKLGRGRYDEIESRSRDYTRRLFADWTPRKIRSFRRLLERFVEDARGVGFRGDGDGGAR